MKRILFVAIIIILGIIHAYSQSLSDALEAKAFTDRFIKLIFVGDYSTAMSSCVGRTMLSKDKLEVLESTTRDQMPGIKSSFGGLIGTEFIRQEQIGSSFLLIIQLLRFEYYALRWNFLFYNNGAEWLLAKIEFNDKILELFSD